MMVRGGSGPPRVKKQKVRRRLPEKFASMEKNSLAVKHAPIMLNDASPMFQSPQMSLTRGRNGLKKLARCRMANMRGR